SDEYRSRDGDQSVCYLDLHEAQATPNAGAGGTGDRTRWAGGHSRLGNLSKHDVIGSTKTAAHVNACKGIRTMLSAKVHQYAEGVERAPANRPERMTAAIEDVQSLDLLDGRNRGYRSLAVRIWCRITTCRRLDGRGTNFEKSATPNIGKHTVGLMS